ncbi:MAG: carbonic anhydrase [Verrucomicrobia bacterium]|nr:carbonic anhydrase [Verrucomicrobiota bacterium]
MLQLIEGVHRFQSEEFGAYRDLFQRLSRDGQKPHTLFITCSDSRVLAELITQSQPGDLFVVKNVGNIVPPAGVTGATNSTAAAIEFAVVTLGVSDIVVCGHSQCGAMHALLEGLPQPEAMPHLEEWLQVAGPVREVVARCYQHLTADALANAAAQENVLFAIENLETYPAVKTRLAAGSLHLHGWFFEIATAELFAFNPATKQFERLTRPGPTPA